MRWKKLKKLAWQIFCVHIRDGERGRQGIGNPNHMRVTQGSPFSFQRETVEDACLLPAVPASIAV